MNTRLISLFLAVFVFAPLLAGAQSSFPLTIGNETKATVGGKSATLKGVTLDKASYIKGDTATVVVEWTPSFYDVTTDPKNLPEGKAYVATAIFTKNGEKTEACSEKKLTSVEKHLIASLIVNVIDTDISGDCPHPIVAVAIITEKGNLLTSAEFSPLVSPEETGFKPSATDILIALFFVILIVLISIIVRKRHDKNKSDMTKPFSGTSGTTMVSLALLIMFSGLLFGTGIQKAYACDPWTGEGCTYDPNGNLTEESIVAAGGTPTESSATVTYLDLSDPAVVAYLQANGYAVPSNPQPGDMYVISSTGAFEATQVCGPSIPSSCPTNAGDPGAGGGNPNNPPPGQCSGSWVTYRGDDTVDGKQLSDNGDNVPVASSFYNEIQDAHEEKYHRTSWASADRVTIWTPSGGDCDPNPNPNPNPNPENPGDENPGDQPPTQCADGIDNDGDGKKDYPADSDCASIYDNNEATVSDFFLESSNDIRANIVGGAPATTNNTTITVGSQGGFNAAVNLSIINISPAIPGITYGFGDSNLSQTEYGNGSSLSATVPGNTLGGTYRITVQGVGGGLTRTTLVNLIVNGKDPVFENF